MGRGLCIGLLVVAVWPEPAAAELGALRAGGAGAAAVVLPPLESEAWGLGCGFFASVGLGRQIYLTALVDLQRFGRRQPGLDLRAYGAALGYAFDIIDPTLFVEVGVARVAVTPDRGVVPAAEILPLLAFGFDVELWPWLWTGAAVRYYPLFDSDLLARPACTLLQWRLTFAWTPGRVEGH
jgi:hypothetical protein